MRKRETGATSSAGPAGGHPLQGERAATLLDNAQQDTIIADFRQSAARQDKASVAFFAAFAAAVGGITLWLSLRDGGAALAKAVSSAGAKAAAAAVTATASGRLTMGIDNGAGDDSAAGAFEFFLRTLSVLWTLAATALAVAAVGRFNPVRHHKAYLAQPLLARLRNPAIATAACVLFYLLENHWIHPLRPDQGFLELVERPAVVGPVMAAALAWVGTGLVHSMADTQRGILRVAGMKYDFESL
jgi:hypothetical protein